MKKIVLILATMLVAVTVYGQQTIEGLFLEGERFQFGLLTG